MDQKATRDFVGMLVVRMKKELKEYDGKKIEPFIATMEHYVSMIKTAHGAQKKPAKLAKKASKKKKDAQDPEVSEDTSTASSSSPFPPAVA